MNLTLSAQLALCVCSLIFLLAYFMNVRLSYLNFGKDSPYYPNHVLPLTAFASPILQCGIFELAMYLLFVPILALDGTSYFQGTLARAYSVTNVFFLTAFPTVAIMRSALTFGGRLETVRHLRTGLFLVVAFPILLLWLTTILTSLIWSPVVLDLPYGIAIYGIAITVTTALLTYLYLCRRLPLNYPAPRVPSVIQCIRQFSALLLCLLIALPLLALDFSPKAPHWIFSGYNFYFIAPPSSAFLLFLPYIKLSLLKANHLAVKPISGVITAIRSESVLLIILLCPVIAYSFRGLGSITPVALTLVASIVGLLLSTTRIAKVRHLKLKQMGLDEVAITSLTRDPNEVDKVCDTYSYVVLACLLLVLFGCFVPFLVNVSRFSICLGFLVWAASMIKIASTAT